jgi:hypothetical protein
MKIKNTWLAKCSMRKQTTGLTPKLFNNKLRKYSKKSQFIQLQFHSYLMGGKTSKE